MGEEIAGLHEAVAVEASAGHAPEPIGAYLSRQRRLRGISLAELAQLTCIPLRSLERLESGAFDGAPDGFARGFVRTVALALGLDADDAVGRMLPEARPGPRRRSVPFPEPRNPWPIVVAAALMAAGLLLWLTSGSGGSEGPADLSAQHVYRHDAVRALAREQSEREAAAASAAPAAPEAGAPPDAVSAP